METSTTINSPLLCRLVLNGLDHVSKFKWMERMFSKWQCRTEKAWRLGDCSVWQRVGGTRASGGQANVAMVLMTTDTHSSLHSSHTPLAWGTVSLIMWPRI